MSEVNRFSHWSMQSEQSSDEERLRQEHQAEVLRQWEQRKRWARQAVAAVVVLLALCLGLVAGSEGGFLHGAVAVLFFLPIFAVIFGLPAWIATGVLVKGRYAAAAISEARRQQQGPW